MNITLPKRGRGRPKKPADEVRDILAAVMLSKNDDSVVVNAAKREGLTKGEWMRKVVLHAAAT